MQPPHTDFIFSFHHFSPAGAASLYSHPPLPHVEAGLSSICVVCGVCACRESAPQQRGAAAHPSSAPVLFSFLFFPLSPAAAGAAGPPAVRVVHERCRSRWAQQRAAAPKQGRRRPRQYKKDSDQVCKGENFIRIIIPQSSGGPAASSRRRSKKKRKKNSHGRWMDG